MINLSSYKLSSKTLNSPQMAINFATSEEFLKVFSELEKTSTWESSINYQTFLADLNREIKIIALNGNIPVRQPMPFLQSEWKWVERKTMWIRPEFNTIKWLTRINEMPISQENKLALSQFILWTSQKFYSLKP